MYFSGLLLLVNLVLQLSVGVIVACFWVSCQLGLLVLPLKATSLVLGILLVLCTAYFGQVTDLLACTDCGILV
jgi:hypothetical protein